MTGKASVDDMASPRIMRRKIASLAVCAGVMLTDGYDLAAMPLAVPYVAAEWRLAPAIFGPAIAAVLVGLGTGALLLGPFGDRFGRRPMIAGGLAILGLATMATAASADLTHFLIWRFFTGLALGICLPNTTALVAELVSPRVRAGAMTAISCAVPVGGVLAGFLAASLVRQGGWPAIFLVPGVVTLLLAVAALICLPPRPAARGEDYAPVPRLPLMAPLARPYWRASAVFIGLYTCNALILYMLSSWLPTLLPHIGFSLADAARLTALVQAGGLVGGLGIAALLDRGLTVQGLLGAYLLVIVMLIGAGFVDGIWWAWAMMLFIIGFGTSGTHLALMAVGTSFYPANMLSTAIGLAVAVARLGAIAGPLLGGMLVARQATLGTFLLVVALPVALCAVGVLFVPTVKRRLI